MRTFHSYGPVDAQFHYAVERRDLIARCVRQLVGKPGEDGHFFTIWASRQTGKTWLMHRAMEEIRARYGDRFIVGALSMQGLFDDDDTDEAFLHAIPRMFRDGFLFDLKAPERWSDWLTVFEQPGGMFDKPLILLIDEFDAMPPLILDKVVRDLRRIYLDRERYVIHGLALIGVRAVLGLESPRGSPFNVQRSLHVPNLSRDEVVDLFSQYRAESGQIVLPEVVEAVFAATRGQPGLVGWLGELLTEKYNPDPKQPITMEQWERVHETALNVEPNNTVLNLIQKAKGPYRDHVIELFSHADVSFSFDKPWCNYLYMNGIIDHDVTVDSLGQHRHVCRFASPFIQRRLFNALTYDLFEDRLAALPLDPRDRLTDVFAGAAIDVAALLERYKAYLGRLKAKGLDPWKGQPRRADTHYTEAVGHFHLYAWLKEALGRRCVVSPEFPTGNGKVDLCLSAGDKRGIIEVKSFTNASALDDGKVQAASYAKKLGLSEALLCVFVPIDDEAVLAELSGVEMMDGVKITTAAIGWG